MEIECPKPETKDEFELEAKGKRQDPAEGIRAFRRVVVHYLFEGRG